MHLLPRGEPLVGLTLPVLGRVLLSHIVLDLIVYCQAVRLYLATPLSTYVQIPADAKKEHIRDGGGCGEIEAPEAGKVLVEPLGQLSLRLVLPQVLGEERARRGAERLLLGAPVVSQEHQPVS